MTRTKRIYNNPRLKKTPRYNLDDKKWHIIVGMPYTRRSWICMGNCSYCKNRNHDTRLIRKRLKAEMKRDFIQEFNLKFF